MLNASRSNPETRPRTVTKVAAPGNRKQDILIARLRRLSRTELLAMYEAAAEATQCMATLTRHGKNPATEVLNGANVVEEWAHFPPGDVLDPSTHSQYYYHAHAADERVTNEHGHFHTFVRPKKLYPELPPAAPTDSTSLDNAATAITHLIGISTDAAGQVIRLFTTNRWVTGEVWYDADSVIRMLERFDITKAQPSCELNRWVSAIVRMFRPQIVDLIRARDSTIKDYQAAHPERDVFDDRDLRVTSEIPVDFLAQIRAIEGAIDSLPAR